MQLRCFGFEEELYFLHYLRHDRTNELLAFFGRLDKPDCFKLTKMVANTRSTYPQVTDNISKKAIVHSPLGQIEPAFFKQVDEELQPILVAERSKNLAHAIDVGWGHKLLIRQLSKYRKNKMQTRYADAIGLALQTAPSWR